MVGAFPHSSYLSSNLMRSNTQGFKQCSQSLLPLAMYTQSVRYIKEAKERKKVRDMPAVSKGWLKPRMVTSSDFPRLNMPRHPEAATGGECTVSADWSTRDVASAARAGSSLAFSRAEPEVPASATSAVARASELSDSLDGEEAEGEDEDGPLRSAAFAPGKNRKSPLLALHQKKRSVGIQIFQP
jgi:hypothetical protein